MNDTNTFYAHNGHATLYSISKKILSTHGMHETQLCMNQCNIHDDYSGRDAPLMQLGTVQL
jgi:hypothetical protein